LPRSRFKTCFISAPFGADTSVLRKILEENSISWRDLTKLNFANNLIIGIDEAISKSDFICAMMPEGENPNILFEMGLAYARQKPILAFLDPSSNPPMDIVTWTYFRTDPKNEVAIRSALATFLRHASKKPVPKGRASRAKSPATPSKRLVQEFSFPGREYAARTARLFQNAGFLVSHSERGTAERPDFAVWIDDLPEPLGNPLLVEVKAGELSDLSVGQAAAQLREDVEKTHGHGGLLFYWDEQNREYPLISSSRPLIFQVGGPTLERLLKQGRLRQELVRFRNVAAHGGV